MAFKNSNKTQYLQDLLFGLLKWGAKGKGKLMPTYEICNKLSQMGFNNIDSLHMGIFLSKHQYKKVVKRVDRSNLTENDEYMTKKETWFFVEFLPINELLLKQKVEKYNPIIENLVKQRNDDYLDKRNKKRESAGLCKIQDDPELWANYLKYPLH